MVMRFKLSFLGLIPRYTQPDQFQSCDRFFPIFQNLDSPFVVHKKTSLMYHNECLLPIFGSPLSLKVDE